MHQVASCLRATHRFKEEKGGNVEARGLKLKTLSMHMCSISHKTALYALAVRCAALTRAGCRLDQQLWSLSAPYSSTKPETQT